MFARLHRNSVSLALLISTAQCALAATNSSLERRLDPAKRPCNLSDKEMEGVGQVEFIFDPQSTTGQVCVITYCLKGYIWVNEEGGLLKGSVIDAIKEKGSDGLPRRGGSENQPVEKIACVKADKMDCGKDHDQCDRPTDTCGAHNGKHKIQCESYIV